MCEKLCGKNWTSGIFNGFCCRNNNAPEGFCSPAQLTFLAEASQFSGYASGITWFNLLENFKFTEI
jgi:hypothetical protein